MTVIAIPSLDDGAVNIGARSTTLPADRRGHFVQFYDDEAFLHERVSDYIISGLRNDQPVIVIATQEHLRAFTDQLMRSASDYDPGRSGGRVTFLDAEETLAKFMRGDLPDWELFKGNLAPLLQPRHGERRGSPACAYGEMVDVLWKGGNREGAIRLEQMWNELAAIESFSLMCGYGMSGFRSARDFRDFQRVCGCHAQVFPTESFSKLKSEQTRLREVGMLQQRARALEAELERRKVLEAELRERENELQEFLDNAVEGIHWVAPDGTILYANRAELMLLGYASSEYVGRNIREFHADQAVIERILALLGTGQSIADCEAKLRCKDGSIKLVSINSNVFVRDGKFVHTRCFTRDITARKLAEERLSFLAKASSILVSSLDYDTTLATVAKLAVPAIADFAAVDMLAPDGQLNRLVIEPADPTRLAQARELARRYSPPHEARGGVWRVIRSGRSDYVAAVTPEVLEAISPSDPALAMVSTLELTSFICVPLRVRGGIVGAITLAFAESGRKYQAEDLQLAEELAGRASLAIENAIHYKAAEDACLAKDEFLAVISHELRTPLNAILGWVHMLKENAVAEDRRAKVLETIERNARAQNQLIDDLLDVSRIVAGKLRLDVDTVDLREVVERAIETVKPAADAKGIALHATLDPDAGPVVGDADRLQQVAWNLLSNAVKFGSRDSAVQIVLCKRDANVELSVSDTGQGIEPAFLPYVFERFRQADNRTARVKGGLGLGLAIARNLVELHGGSIRAESAGVGRGASFTVCLPISPLRQPSFSRPPALHLTAAAPHVPCPPEIAGLNILVVDDEDDARDLLAALLVRCGVKTTPAASVAQAIQMVQEQRPDIVISDIGMPGEDGYALIKKLRRLAPEDGGLTPVVALTAYARTEERAKALVSGFNMHVPKPVEPSELLAVLASLATGFQSRVAADRTAATSG